MTGGGRADNTDVAGMISALREAGLARVEQAVILGAGGTAQSALAAVHELAAASPIVLVRDLAPTGELRETAGRLGMRPTTPAAYLRSRCQLRDLGHFHAAGRRSRSVEFHSLATGHHGA